VTAAKTATSMALIVDVRERSLCAALTQIGTPFTTAGLEVGDALFQTVEGQPLLVVERKTLHDYAASNEDGRYREQRARLMAARGGGSAALYILEGSFPNFIGTTRTSQEQLKRLTTRLVLRYGMPVLQTTDCTDTARWLTTMLAQLTADTSVFQPEGGLATATAAAMSHMTAALSLTKKANRDAGSVATGMLGAVPGLGPKRVEALLAEHSIADLVAAADGAALGSLVVGGKRLGPALGGLLWEALHWRHKVSE